MNAPDTMRALRARLRRVRGVCLTHYINACDRHRTNPRRRPCLTAYAGHGRQFKSKRFFLDTLGITLAFTRAILWRRSFANVPLHVRTCDVRRKVRASLSRAKK